jgi:hypothetical protein
MALEDSPTLTPTGLRVTEIDLIFRALAHASTVDAPVSVTESRAVARERAWGNRFSRFESGFGVGEKSKEGLCP